MRKIVSIKLRRIALREGAPYRSVKRAYKRRHTDGLDAVLPKLAAPRIRKPGFKGFKRNQPSYNKPTSMRPIGLLRDMAAQFKLDQLADWLRWDYRKIAVLPKMTMMHVLGRYLQGERVLA